MCLCLFSDIKAKSYSAPLGCGKCLKTYRCLLKRFEPPTFDILRTSICFEPPNDVDMCSIRCITVCVTCLLFACCCPTLQCRSSYDSIAPTKRCCCMIRCEQPSTLKTDQRRASPMICYAPATTRGHLHLPIIGPAIKEN